MDIEQVVNILANYGMSFAVTIYFLYRDWKFNEALLTTMTTLKDSVSVLTDTVHRLHSDD